VSALFFDEPTVEVLNRVGVDFTSVGNHEFDKGAAELLRLQHGGCRITRQARSEQLQGPRLEGAGHVRRRALPVAVGQRRRDRHRPHAAAAVRHQDVRGHPRRLHRHDAQGHAGHRLAHRRRRASSSATRPTPSTRWCRSCARKAWQAIVVLVHQGGMQPSVRRGRHQRLRRRAARRRRQRLRHRRIVRRLDDAVDLVISAHTHAAYNCSANAVGAARATGLPNRAGRLVPVTSASAFGRVLTDIDVTLDAKTHRVLSGAPKNLLVDRGDPAIAQAIAAAPAVRDIVQGYAALAAPLADGVVGPLAAALPAIENDAGEEPAGSLIADTQLRATQPAALGGAQIAFMNAGGVRSPGFVPAAGATPPFALTYGAVFTVQPFGNSLVTMTLTSAQLKALLEQQFAGCGGRRKRTGPCSRPTACA
jgi:5'-nucleotidase